MAVPDLQTKTTKTSKAPHHEAKFERNPGIPLDLGWVNAERVNLSATERRAATLGTRRSIKKDWQAAWLTSASRRARSASITRASVTRLRRWKDQISRSPPFRRDFRRG